MSLKVIEEPTFRNKKYVFRDRDHAGELLAKKLEGYSSEDTIVLAIPSGGVPVGYRVAERLRAPLDLIVVRKIPIPGNPEAGYGSVSWDGDVVLNKPLVRSLALTKEEIEKGIQEVKRELEMRLKKFRGEKPFPSLKEKVVIIVDDGLASGYTMLASIRAIAKHAPKKIIVAVPTASLGSLKLISSQGVEMACLNVREGFYFAVADAYKNWYDLGDEEVLEILKKPLEGFEPSTA